MSKFTIAIGTLLVPAVAVAHPEHVTSANSGLSHLFTDPFHLALAGAVALLVVMTRRSLVRVRSED